MTYQRTHSTQTRSKDENSEVAEIQLVTCKEHVWKVDIPKRVVSCKGCNLGGVFKVSDVKELDDGVEIVTGRGKLKVLKENINSNL